MKPTSAIDSLPPAAGVTARRAGPAGRFEQMLMAASEKLNPILVKEARQALKSKQFSITFSLLLAFGWVWSLIGVAVLSPGIYYAPGGRFMLGGYFLILAAPVLIIIPFSAFRSLAAEREDGTFELLSITALSSRQIVTGKLGSSLLQTLVYYSALSPCVAFTYLLRGVDIFTILYVLAATFLASLFLSSIGLMVATAARARHWQVVISVLLLVGLVFATLMWVSFMLQVIAMGVQALAEDPMFFWQMTLAVLSFHGAIVALFVVTAAGQLSFASDNRSTRVRIVLLLQQVLWIGWLSFAWLQSEEEEALLVLVAVAAMFWFLVGALLTGEYAELSPRVKRSLPQSFLGRAFLTWFNPGSGTGYAFATVNLLAVCAIVATLGAMGTMVGFGGSPDTPEYYLYTALCFCYVATYLGTGRLCLLAARRFVRISMMASVLVQLGLAVAGTAVPALLQAWLLGYRDLAYTEYQVTNWIWTLAETLDRDLLFYPAVPILVAFATLIVIGLNMLFAMEEVAQVRQTTPARVIADQEAS